MSILNDAIASELPFLQQQAESMMTLTLTAYEPSGTTIDADGYEVPAFINHGTTPGKAQGGSQAGKDTSTRYVKIGNVSRPVLEGGLHIPLGAFVTGDGLGITASEQVSQAWQFQVTSVNGLADIALLGRRYMVYEVPAKSYATARRLTVVEI